MSRPHAGTPRFLDRFMLILRYGVSDWHETVHVNASVTHGMIAAPDLDLFRFVTTPAPAVEARQTGLVTGMEPVTPAFGTSTPCPVEARPS